jgi:hypothetical protein
VLGERAFVRTDDIVRPFLQAHAGENTAPAVFSTFMVKIVVVEVERGLFVGD